MKILMVACSKNGYELMMRVQKQLNTEDVCCVVKCKSMPAESVEEKLSDIVAREFIKVDAIVVFGAVGIAVRLIAPCIAHKSTDPAVIAIDEAGKYCIPVLSGHAGGANELAKKLADILMATPIITTATDVEGLFAVDDFARKNQLVLSDWSLAKNISAAILAGKQVELVSDLPVDGLQNIPSEIVVGLSAPWRIIVSDRKNVGEGLHLVPKDIVVGVGCRKDIKIEQVRRAIDNAIEQTEIHPSAIGALASIDLKKDEAGILTFCQEREIPFIVFGADELVNVPGDFTKSAFVESVTGVDNVCERSAALACMKLNQENTEESYEWVARKVALDGVTVAIARRKERIRFE